MNNSQKHLRSKMESNPYPKQHTIGKSVFLHIFPGAVLTGLLLMLAPAFSERGLPPMLALIVVDALIVLPMMMGIIYYHARNSGLADTSKIISFGDKIGFGKILSYSGILLLWAVIVFALLSPFTEFIKQELFFWVPEWLSIGDYAHDQDSYSGPVIILTWVLALFWTSIATPIVEELYFRGFLLPALSRFGKWAPFINTVLFAVYHFWSLWLLPIRIIALLPMVYTVWFKRSVFIGILVHVLLNLIGDSILTIPFVFGSH